MFSLCKIKHKFSLPPDLLGESPYKAIKEELDRIFLDKVIQNHGLCISVYDILEVEGGFIIPGEGAPTYDVTFRMVVFCPFLGEIIDGKIEKSGPDGLRVSLGFFSDINIPVHLLPLPRKMEESGTWVWIYKPSEEDEANEMFMDLDEKIRFRVQTIKYPPIPIEQNKDGEPFAPMEITGSVLGDGLGLVSWWECDKDMDNDSTA